MNVILICCDRPQVFELCHIFKRFISYPYILVLSWVRMTSVQCTEMPIIIIIIIIIISSSSSSSSIKGSESQKSFYVYFSR